MIKIKQGLQNKGNNYPEMLDLVITAMSQLRHDGKFDEPNLDGTPGDYISFHSWEWPQGVGIWGLVKLWRQTSQAGQNKELREVIKGWFDAAIERGLPDLNVNTTAPMLAMSLFWSESGHEDYRPVLDKWADRVIRDLPRTEEGAFQHDVSDRINTGELWDDTLFMTGLFLAHYGIHARRAELYDEAMHQMLVHARYLCDPQTGLWYHGWSFEGRHNFARALWARGNAWIVIVLAELLDWGQLPGNLTAHFSACLDTHLAALINHQRDDGAWSTLIDHADSYPEISATAGIGYSLLKCSRLGLLDQRTHRKTTAQSLRQAGLKALSAVAENVSESGMVGQVSYGTRMGNDLDFYKSIPLQATGYGQALALLCLLEGCELRNS